MTDHPLTSEIVQSIWDKVGNEKSGGFTQDDLMRAASDWQLEQVIEWLEATLTAGDVIAEDLKKAMRPQEDN